MNQATLQAEKQDQIKAGIISVLVNVFVFLLLFLIKTLHTPQVYPPPGGGIEINYGTTDFGSGSIQTKNKPSSLPNKIESKPAEKVENTKTKPEKIEKITPPKPIKATKVEAKEAPIKTSKAESPVKIEEKPTPKNVEPTPKPVENKVEAKPEPKQPTVDSKAIYKKGGSNNANGTSGTSPEPGGNSNGDDAKGVGDKGNPEGKVDAKALYGKPGSGGGTGGGNGGGNGASLNMTGWTWSSRPKVDDDSDESGKIVLQVKIDDQGDIISVKIIEKTVSQSVADKYKRAVERLNFVPTGSGARSATSTGTIVFNIKAK